MKKIIKKLNLQMFADDDEGASGTDQEDIDSNKDDDPNPKKDEKKYSDDDLDKIINSKFAKWQKQQEKAVKEAEKLANMNAQERAEHERDELQKQIDSYRKKETIAEMTKVARQMISDEQITVGDNVLAMLVSDDAETTKKAITDFSKAFKEAVEAEVKVKLKGNPPKKGTKDTTMTKEKIFAVKDPAERQKLIRENMELFQ